jgi:hypothetical protein
MADAGIIVGAIAAAPAATAPCKNPRRSIRFAVFVIAHSYVMPG